MSREETCRRVLLGSYMCFLSGPRSTSLWCQRIDSLRARQLPVLLVEIPTDRGHGGRFVTESKVTTAPQQNEALESTAGSGPTVAFSLALTPRRKSLRGRHGVVQLMRRRSVRGAHNSVAISISVRHRRDQVLAPLTV